MLPTNEEINEKDYKQKWNCEKWMGVILRERNEDRKYT